eukprot:UN3036
MGQLHVWHPAKRSNRPNQATWATQYHGHIGWHPDLLGQHRLAKVHQHQIRFFRVNILIVLAITRLSVSVTRGTINACLTVSCHLLVVSS